MKNSPVDDIVEGFWQSRRKAKISDTLRLDINEHIRHWVETAMQHSRNEEFYRDLLDECAVPLGKAAFTADSGDVMDDPVRLKIPELVRELAEKVDTL